MLQLSAASMDVPQTGFMHSFWIPLLLVPVWIVASFALTTRRRWQSDGARLVLIGSGILLVGWLTYTGGIIGGLTFMMLGGLPVLIWRGTGRSDRSGGGGGIDRDTSQAMLLNATVDIDARTP